MCLISKGIQDSDIQERIGKASTALLQPISKLTELHQLIWYVHLIRMDEAMPVKKI